MFRRHHVPMAVADRIDHVMAAVFIGDDHERMERLEQHVAFDVVYISPGAVFDGPLGLSDAFARLRHDDWRHASLHRTSVVDLHHAFFRYTWQRMENGSMAMEGTSFGSVNADGLIDRIVSFEGLLPDRLPGARSPR